MDEPFLSRSRPEEESTRISTRREFPSGYIDIGQSYRQSTAHLITSDAIIPIIATPKSPYINILSTSNRKRKIAQRSYSAPALFSDIKEAFRVSSNPRPCTKLPPLIVRQAFVGLILYFAIGVVIYLTTGSFRGKTTFKPVDAMYFTVVTLCTIGYGDIVPDSTFTKLFTCAFILVGFGFIDILLNGLVVYICDRQEAVLLSTVDENRFNAMVKTYMIDREKGRMRIRTKVCLAVGVVVICIAVGTIAIHFLETLTWVDSVYLSITSVSTVGYGDYSFTTLEGRCFAIIWLLVSTLAVARAFLYLTEFRIDKRNRKTAAWVLQKKITIGDLVAADIDHNGSISKSEFVIYKLKEMGKIAEKDVLLIGKQFDLLDTSYCGKLTLADLMEQE